MLSPQDDRSTDAVQASLISARRTDGTAPSGDRSPGGHAEHGHATASERTRRAATDRFRRTSDRAFLGLVAELARTDRTS